jgi:hypothetical protein
MSFLYFMFGGLIGVFMMAMFSVRAYEKGYVDAIRDILHVGTEHHDDEYMDYKKQLAAFMQSVNPKPTVEDLEKLRKQYLDKRS